MPSVSLASSPAVTLLPYALWTAPEGAPAALRQAIDSASLPNLRAWLAQSRQSVAPPPVASPGAPAPLSLPHEHCLAQAMGWTAVDGALPWAAQRALALGLIPASSPSAPPAAWGFISLCHWQVSNGQVTLGDPTHLSVDEATDAALFEAMVGFFAEDGLTLHRDVPGRWLVQSPLLADLPTASLDRVIGRNIDPWLVGGAAPSGVATLLRRLQNEMQMLLYTHPVNAQRGLSINSFWLHGTGALPASDTSPLQAWHVDLGLRDAAVQQDLVAWLDAWVRLDAEVLAPLLARAAQGARQRLILTGEHVHHVYDSLRPSVWQRWRNRFSPPSLAQALAVDAPRE